MQTKQIEILLNKDGEVSKYNNDGVHWIFHCLPHIIAEYHFSGYSISKLYVRKGNSIEFVILMLLVAIFNQ